MFGIDLSCNKLTAALFDGFLLTLDVGRNCTGLGVIIRDSAGMVLLVGVKRLAGALNPEMAEALAVLFGLSLSAEAGIHPISLDKLVLLME
ncbi:hypothetical protein ACOSP7_031934 [Xanthoceras sorbifolium]